jgi:Tfp pilus assembly protein FimT
MLIAVALSAVLALIAFQGMRETLPRWRINAAARAIRSDLVQVRSLAVKDMREYRVVFAGASYNIERGNARAGSAWPQPVIKTIRLDNFPGVQVETSLTGVPVFRPNGTTSTPGVVIVLSSGTLQRTLTVALSGRVNIS